MFWSVEGSGGVLGGLDYGGFLAFGLPAYGSSALCAALPRGLIREGLAELVWQAFSRECSLYLACGDRDAFLPLGGLGGIGCGRVVECVILSVVFWAMYL